MQAVWQAARLFETWQTKLTNKQTNKQTSKQNKQANKQTKNKHSAASCLAGSKAVRNLMPPKMQQTNITTIKQIKKLTNKTKIICKKQSDKTSAQQTTDENKTYLSVAHLIIV